MLSCLYKCLTCTCCRNTDDKEDAKFLLKHAILVKGSYIIVVFTRNVTGGHEFQEYVNDHYQLIENVPHPVGLNKQVEYYSSIEAEEDETEIAPPTSVNVSYKSLKQQCVIHRVRIKTQVVGQQNLQLHISYGNTKVHSYPFHVSLNTEDLYMIIQPRSPANMQESSMVYYNQPSINESTVDLNDGLYSSPGTKFQLKHNILVKGSYINVVYFTNDDAGNEEVQKYVTDRYQVIENVPHSVGLHKQVEYYSSIEAEENETEIPTAARVSVSYESLKHQCVIHRVRIKTQVVGQHNLQLHITNGNTKVHSYPFHVSLNTEDLFVAVQHKGSTRSQEMQDGYFDEDTYEMTECWGMNNAGPNFQLCHVILRKGSYVAVVYFSNDATGDAEVKKYISDRYKRVENVTHRVGLPTEMEFTSYVTSEDGAAKITPDTGVLVSYEALQQQCVVHRVRIKTSSVGELYLHLQLKIGSEIKQNYPFDVTFDSENLYEKLERNASTVRRDPEYDIVAPDHENLSLDGNASIVRRDPEFELRQTMREYGVEHIWPLLKREGTLLKQEGTSTHLNLANINNETLKSLGVKNGDRMNMLKVIASLGIRDNEAFEPPKRQSLPRAMDDLNFLKNNQERPLPDLPDETNVNHNNNDKIDLSTILVKLKLKNLESIFKKERLSSNVIKEMKPSDFEKFGIKISDGRKIIDAVNADTQL